MPDQHPHDRQEDIYDDADDKVVCNVCGLAQCETRGFCAKCRADEAAARKAAGTRKANGSGGGKGLPFVLFDHVENVPKTWLVDGFLGIGEMSCLYGEPGSGKSVLAEDLGLHVAGRFSEWLGREISTHGAVIYIALERPNLVKRRAVAFKIKHNAHGLPFAIVSGTHDFRDPKTATLILETLAEVERTTGEKVVLIILDTISRALCGGDENSPKDMGALITAIRNITNNHAPKVAAQLLFRHQPGVPGSGFLEEYLDDLPRDVKEIAR